MDVMFLNNLRKKVYEANKANGFWDYYRNQAEALFLVTSEMVEAMEVHRAGGMIAPDLTLFKQKVIEQGFTVAFKENIKDSFADELADSVIRVLDFCGGYGYRISLVSPHYVVETPDNIGEYFFKAEGIIRGAYDCIKKCYSNPIIEQRFSQFILHIYVLAESLNIDLTEHILLKLAYNETRGKRHGKSY